MSSSQWACPEPSNGTMITTSSPGTDEIYRERLQGICGSLTLASLVQIFVGTTGLIGFLTNYIGPLTIVPTVSLISISMSGVINGAAQHQYGITILTVGLVVLFVLILGNFLVPIPNWSKQHGCHFVRYPVFKMFANFFALILVWIFSLILTETGVYSSDPDSQTYKARTDAKLDAIYKAKWIFIPYPGQWGMPSFNLGIFIGMLGAVICGIIESVADYYATARVCKVPPPPKHAINRGIALEGVSCILSGLFGSAHGTTSYSEVVGVIAYTRVCSRLVWQVSGLCVILFGIIGKFGAGLSTLPDPIIGGLLLTGLSMVLSVALSNLQALKLSSVRNQMILGLSLMIGICLPSFFQDHPELLKTGVSELDSMLIVLLTTAPIIGGITGFILDNIIPGNKVDRGITQPTDGAASASNDVPLEMRDTDDTLNLGLDFYDLPLANKFQSKQTWLRHIPCCSCYEPKDQSICKSCCAKQNNDDDIEYGTKEVYTNDAFESFNSHAEECDTGSSSKYSNTWL